MIISIPSLPSISRNRVNRPAVPPEYTEVHAAPAEGGGEVLAAPAEGGGNILALKP